MQTENDLTNKIQNLTINDSGIQTQTFQLIQEWEKGIDLALKFQVSQVIMKIDESERFINYVKDLEDKQEASNILYLIADKMIDLIDINRAGKDSDIVEHLLNSSLKICNLAKELKVSSNKFYALESTAKLGINCYNTLNSSIKEAKEHIQQVAADLKQKRTQEKPVVGNFTKALNDNQEHTLTKH